MKRNDIQALKAKPLLELEAALAEARERLRVLRFDLAAGKVKNVGELRTVRKTIARLMTFIAGRSRASSAPRP